MNKKERETKFNILCKCGNHLKAVLSSPTGTWWFTCARCGKYYWKGLRGFLGAVKHKYFGEAA